MMKRYQVVTYSRDIGADEHLGFSKFSEAKQHALKYSGIEEHAAVYDEKEKTAYVIFGNLETQVFTPCVRIISKGVSA